jgi:hypothetical protein
VKITPTLYLSNRNQRYARLFENDKWADSVQQEMEREQFTRAFENFVLEGMDAAERAGKEKLEQMQRIQMLLKMLEFPGPDRDWTCYMTIEPNEFKERPVLADPLHIVPSSLTRGESKPAPKPKPAASPQGRAEKIAPAPAEKRQAAPPQMPQSAAPVSPYKVGDTFNGKVNNIWGDGTFIIETPKLKMQQGYARVAKADAAGKGWQMGDNASCEVVSISTDAKGRVVLVCKAPTKKPKK